MASNGVIIRWLERRLGGWLLKVHYTASRDAHRPIPLWMLLNLYRGRCWCGAPATRHNWGSNNPGAHSCEKRLGIHKHHGAVWNQYIRCWWGWYRELFLRQYPACAACGAKKSSEVDHVEALSLGGEMWEPGNHQALCQVCHKTKTAEDMGKLAAKRRRRMQDERDIRLGHRQAPLEAFPA